MDSQILRKSSAIQGIPHRASDGERGTEYLKIRFRTLVASINYISCFELVFPVINSRIVVQAQEPPKSGGLSSLFLRNKPNSNVARYQVVRSVWPFAKRVLATSDNNCERDHTVQSEEMWVKKWKNCIRYCLVAGRREWVTEEDRMDVAIDPAKANTYFMYNTSGGPEAKIAFQ